MTPFVVGAGVRTTCERCFPFETSIPAKSKFSLAFVSETLSEKIAVMVVTSSADRPQIYSERVRNLSGFNRTKLEQDGGNPVRLIQDLLQA